MNPKPQQIGKYNAICDVCGRQYKNDELRDRWDGAKVCSDDFEPQHPMDFQKIPRTEKSVPWSRPVPENTFTSVTYADTDADDIPTGTFNVTDPIG